MPFVGLVRGMGSPEPTPVDANRQSAPRFGCHRRAAVRYGAESVMAYRSLTDILGATSLERKCRFLFGLCLFVLIAGSFW